MRLTHLIAGPEEHGVSEYALALQAHTGGRVARPGEELAAGPVHVTFTDHLFGPDPDAAVTAVLAQVDERPLSVSFHDVPQPQEGEGRFARRARAYVRLAAAAELAVVNSRHEAGFFTAAGIDVEVVHLPLPTAPARKTAPQPGSVGILGFIYPGKGHADVLAAVPELPVRALGGFSAGHERLAEELSDLEVTGYLPEQQLWEEMSRIQVPVCAHRHFSASGSLMRWIAAGRRVLVPDSAYTREIADLWPGQIVLVDDWRQAILAAAEEPEFAEPVAAPADWGWVEVSRRWRELWDEAFRPWLRGNRRPVPGAPAPAVSVVIPYFNDPAGLREVLAGVAASDFDGEVEVIVADDGSTIPPEVDSPLPVRVVRQEDRGFRAAAARNLGAAHARHPVLVFLDGDTVPGPGYLSAATRWVAAQERAVVVGERRQDGVEPAWLRDAWADTEDLERADETSWRFVLSCVLTCSTQFFRAIGGFDDSMVGYGGEDWEFGWRAWNAGAVFIHEPQAVADHREDDWAARRVADDGVSVAGVAEKNAESQALARRITHPIARPQGVLFDTADVVVTFAEVVAAPGVRERVIASWAGAGDTQVQVAEIPELFAADPRVGPHAQGRVRVDLLRPVLAPEDLPGLIAAAESMGGRAEVIVDGDVVAAVTAPRTVGDVPARLAVRLEYVAGPVRLERWFAQW